jgi:hypothetical protein
MNERRRTSVSNGHKKRPQHLGILVEANAEVRPYSSQERATITAGAIAAVLATGMLFAIAMALLLTP